MQIHFKISNIEHKPLVLKKLFRACCCYNLFGTIKNILTILYNIIIVCLCSSLKAGTDFIHTCTKVKHSNWTHTRYTDSDIINVKIYLVYNYMSFKDIYYKNNVTMATNSGLFFQYQLL